LSYKLYTAFASGVRGTSASGGSKIVAEEETEFPRIHSCSVGIRVGPSSFGGCEWAGCVEGVVALRMEWNVFLR